MTKRTWGAVGAGLLSLAMVTSCGDDSSAGSDTKAITLYTCVNDTTIGPVIDAFKKANPGTDVELFRAPTGDLNARIAGDVRSGGLKADVVWACDPLTMADYSSQDLVGGWTPQTSIPADYRTDNYVGVAMLYVVAVAHDGVPAPKAWTDLTSRDYAAGVAVPDPSVAASALGALGYFSGNADYGIDFYSTLKDNGATQVSTPDDVVTGVAEGTYDAGITIASSAYAAQTAGSPIEVSWPSPGAIGVYGPIALSKTASNATTAKDFISYVASQQGQTVLADSGAYPTLAGVTGPTKPADAAVVFPDWSALSTSKNDLLAAYQQIFGG